MGARGKVLLDVLPEHEFVLVGGSRLKNLRELAKAINGIGEEGFRHHVNAEKNDFYNWVRDVFKDKELASAILKSSSRAGIMMAIQKRLAVPCKKISRRRNSKCLHKKALKEKAAIIRRVKRSSTKKAGAASRKAPRVTSRKAAKKKGQHKKRLGKKGMQKRLSAVYNFFLK